MKVFKPFGFVLFIISLLLLLITFNLRGLINEMDFYQWGFEKYHISQKTGIPEKELLRAARTLTDYFNLKRESPQIQVLKDGKEIKLFNERELIHLKDVKNLIQRCYTLGWASLAYVLGYLLVGFIWLKKSFLPRLSRSLFFGGIFTVFSFGFVGVWALIDFESLFLIFHQAVFRNELWMLNPAKDYLIAMFPEGFFFHAAFFLAGAVVVEALLLAIPSWVYLRKRRGCA